MTERSNRINMRRSTTNEQAGGGASESIREITPRAVVLGILLALILGAANAYLGLFAGMTVSASIPAAVLSMAVLRALGAATILENNVVQTIASAGEAVAAGAIFTFPALVILGHSGPLPYSEVTILCIVGSTMGSLLIVFLRRAYIVEERLPYPEGVACAEVLRAGESAAAGARPLLWGGIVGVIIKAAQESAGLLPTALNGARWLGGTAFAGSLDLSAALLGVGYIVGVPVGVLVFAGGAVAWLVAIPILSLLHPELHALDAHAAAMRLWNGHVRYLGVGAMLVGGIVTVARLRGQIARGLGEGTRLIGLRGTAAAPNILTRVDTDLPARTVLTAVGLCVPALFMIAYLVSANFWLAGVLAIALVVLGFFASAVAGYLTGIVGASNNPVSGVTVIVLLGVAALLTILGVSKAAGPRLAIMTGAVVCTTAAMAGDSLHDLATGYHVGATPRALEVAVLLGAIASSFVMAPVLNLLISGYGIAGTPGAQAGALPAPQAFLMAQVTRGIFSGGLPWDAITIGTMLGVGIEALNRWLEQRETRWRLPVMPVALGLYLPFGLSTAILLGSLPRLFVDSNVAQAKGRGLLFAAGLIAGEALMGVFNGALVTLHAR
jgi:putative OPT family oligopeptide transporter